MRRLSRRILAVLLVPVGLLASSFLFFIWQFSAFKTPINNALFWPFLACAVATIAVPVKVWPRHRVDGDRGEPSPQERARFRAVLSNFAIGACLVISAATGFLDGVPSTRPGLFVAGSVALLRRSFARHPAGLPPSISTSAILVALAGLVAAPAGIIELLTISIVAFLVAVAAAFIQRPQAVSAGQTTEE